MIISSTSTSPAIDTSLQGSSRTGSPSRMGFQRHPLLVTKPTVVDGSLSTSLSASLPLSAPMMRPASSHSLTSLDTDAAGHETLSDDSVQDEDEADVEASLRFPTFARRGLATSRVRRHSPLRSPLTLEELKSSSQDCVNTTHSPNTTGHDPTTEPSGEELFCLDDDDDDETNEDHRPVQHNPYGMQADDDMDDDHASLPLSMAYSNSSHSACRTSDRSSTDLEMIWDDEDDEHAIGFDSDENGKKLRSIPMTKDSSNGSSAGAGSLGKLATLDISSSMHSPDKLSRSASWRVRRPQHVSPTSYAVPTLPFARKTSESMASPPSAYLSNLNKARRLSFVAPTPAPLVRRGSMKQQDHSAPALHTSFVNDRRSTHPISSPVSPEAVLATSVVANDVVSRAQPLHGSGSTSSLSTTTTTTPILGRKRSSTDPPAMRTCDTCYAARTIKSGPTSPDDGLSDSRLEHRRSAPLAASPQKSFTNSTVGSHPDYYLRMFGLGPAASTKHSCASNAAVSSTRQVE